MQATNDKPLDFFDRFTVPVKYKLKFYQIAIMLFIDQIIALITSKYLFIRVVIEENKPNFRPQQQIEISFEKYKTSFLQLTQQFKTKIDIF